MKSLFCIAGLCILLGACEKPADIAAEKPQVEGQTLSFAPDSPQLKALTAIVAEQASAETLRLSGRLGWDETRTVRVYAPLGGRVMQLRAQPGDKVKAGQVLATLSSPDFGTAQADAAKAAADLSVAEKSIDRARQLHEAGVIADKDLQQAEADFARARAERNRTTARSRAYGGSGDSIDQQFTLRTPITGVVVERHVNPGQEVRPEQADGHALFVISDPDQLWANLDVPENMLDAICPGMDVELHLTALGEKTRTARIEHVADFIDPDTRRTRARAVVENQDRRLKAEMFANADISVSRGEFIRVPATAVVLLGKDQYVFVQEAPGRYRRQAVKAEEAGFGNMRIREGIKAGEHVVSVGTLLLQQILAMTVKK